MRLWSAVERFVTGVTRTGSLVAAALVVALFCAGIPLCARAIVLGVPDGAQLVLSSRSNITLQEVRAMIALAGIAALGWIVSALRGVRRRSPTGLAALLARAAAIAVGAAVGVLLAAWAIHSFWLEALAQPLPPMVAIDEMPHWRWATWGALVAAALLVVVDASRRPAPPRDER